MRSVIGPTLAILELRNIDGVLNVSRSEWVRILGLAHDFQLDMFIDFSGVKEIKDMDMAFLAILVGACGNRAIASFTQDLNKSVAPLIANWFVSAHDTKKAVNLMMRGHRPT